MNTRLLAGIAVRQLSARRRRSVAIVVGTAIGVAVMLITLSMFGGLLESFTVRILDVTPHVIVTGESSPGESPDMLLDNDAAVEIARAAPNDDESRIRNVMSVVRLVERELDHDIVVASPYLATRAFASHGVTETTIPILGVIPARYAELSTLHRYIESGSVARLTASRNGILLGHRVATDLGVEAGDRIRLVSLTGHLFPAQVVGIYRFGVEASDRAAIVNLRLAQSLVEAFPGEATAVGIKLADPKRADEAALMLERLTGRRVETWSQSNAGFLSIFNFLQTLFRVVVGFVVLISAFGVANIVTTTVHEKRNDIAIMKSMGVTQREVTMIYLLYGVLLSFVGSLLGIVVGSAGMWVFGHLPAVGAGGISPVDSPTFEMSWSPWYMVAAVGSSCLAALIAACVPARAAARVAPVEILRGEG